MNLSDIVIAITHTIAQSFQFISFSGSHQLHTSIKTQR